MKLITEEITQVEYITEGVGEQKQHYIQGVFMQSETKNRNGRIYPKSVLEKETNRITQSML
jgi:Prohead core protein serine protease